jgi:hypothetical protein
MGGGLSASIFDFFAVCKARSHQALFSHGCHEQKQERENHQKIPHCNSNEDWSRNPCRPPRHSQDEQHVDAGNRNHGGPEPPLVLAIKHESFNSPGDVIANSGRDTSLRNEPRSRAGETADCDARSAATMQARTAGRHTKLALQSGVNDRRERTGADFASGTTPLAEPEITSIVSES